MQIGDEQDVGFHGFDSPFGWVAGFSLSLTLLVVGPNKHSVSGGELIKPLKPSPETLRLFLPTIF